MVKTLLLFIQILTLLSFIKAASDCQFKSAVSGDNYDFSSLANTTDYSFADIKSSATFYFNFCATASTCVEAGVVNSAVCQKNSNGFSTCGLLGTQKFTDITGQKGANMTYYKGDVCGNGRPRQMSLVCTCDPSTDMKFSKVEESATCMYNIYCSSKNACPVGAPSSGGSKSGGIGGGWIFIIILVVCSTVYIVGGVIFNLKVRNLSGKELFPNYSFWSEFPGLLKDGIFFIKGKITGTGSSYGGYQQV